MAATGPPGSRCAFRVPVAVPRRPPQRVCPGGLVRRKKPGSSPVEALPADELSTDE